MIINVTELLKEVGEDADVRFSETASYAEDGLTLLSPVSISAHLVNSGQGVLVTGRAEADADLVCSRCLNSFRQHLTTELHERFVPSVPGDEPEEKELDDADFVSPMIHNSEIDLSEAVRQNILMAVPMTPLCRPDCPGLSVGDKKLEFKWDPRWNKLKEIL